MKQVVNLKALARAVAVVAAVSIVVSGVTFAALQSQAGVLKGNIIQTAVASLQVSPNGVTYSSSMDGYVFGNLVPGGQSSPNNGYPVYVKNVGTTPLAVKLSVKGLVTNPDGVDLTKVHVQLTPIAGGASQNILLQDLIAADTTGGIALNLGTRLNQDQSIVYLLRVSLDADAVVGSSATLSNVDFNFGALAVN
ncbi:MAG: hypothetical protein JWO35_313 [Candidatus Saccharibacteria bacterium]|nr:hypothetical protein [Candidatus Saccharibacteria bacterium]